MEYTFRKWRTLRQKFSIALLIPTIALSIFSVYYIAGTYQDFLREVHFKNDLNKMMTLSGLKFEIDREAQAMRSFYLGVRNFDHLRLQKDFTEKAIKDFRKEFAGETAIIQGLETNVVAALSAARDKVLSGQSRWPETEKEMETIRLWMISFSPNYSNFEKIYPYMFQLEKLQEGVISARELNNHLSFVIVRDMPLNSIQFSQLISSYERAQYLHRQSANFLMSGTDRMKFLYNQQMMMWGKIKADYDKTLETIEQGRYGIRLPELIKEFERLEKSQLAPVQLKKETIFSQVEQTLSAARSKFLFSFIWVSLVVAFCMRMTLVTYRKGLFYLATSFNGHDIKIINEEVGAGNITPLYPLHSREEEYIDRVHKHIA